MPDERPNVSADINADKDKHHARSATVVTGAKPVKRRPLRARAVPDGVPPPEDCPLEDVIALLAGAWTIRILWYLCQRPRRFGDLRRNLGNVRAKVLTQRLRTLQKRGLVARRPIESALREVEYSVTPLGRELEPVLDAMGQVAARLPKTGAPRGAAS